MSTSDSASRQSHVPVMLTECIGWLKIQASGIYLDGTIGLGGHATAIHSLLNRQGKLIGTDLDEEALNTTAERFAASSPPVSLHHAPYSHLPQILQKEGLPAVNGILLDLGLSSLQLDSAGRGFAFSTDAPLDMRFGSRAKKTASDLIRTTREADLADLIYKYGEERRSRPIARSIKRMDSMATTGHLREAIRRATPPKQRDRTLARVFQALRIAVNGELEKLERFLSEFIDYLTVGGRIVILSYHSLEDRLVKHTFKRLAAEGRLTILTKKPQRPTEEEVQTNRRAKPAKLRAAERSA